MYLIIIFINTCTYSSYLSIHVLTHHIYQYMYLLVIFINTCTYSSYISIHVLTSHIYQYMYLLVIYINTCTYSHVGWLLLFNIQGLPFSHELLVLYISHPSVVLFIPSGTITIILCVSVLRVSWVL